MTEYRSGYGQAKADALDAVKEAAVLVSGAMNSAHWERREAQAQILKYRLDALRWVKTLIRGIEPSRKYMTKYTKAQEPLLNEDPVLEHFEYSHLPPELQVVSRQFHDLAWFTANMGAPGRERTKALDLILAAKDAAVRSHREKQLENSSYTDVREVVNAHG